MRIQWNGPKSPGGQVLFGIGIMLAGVAAYVYLSASAEGLTMGSQAVILVLIAIGFCYFTVGAVRYLKALEAAAKAAMEDAEREKEATGAQPEDEKKREELKTLLRAGLISRDEYECAMKKHTK